MDRHCGTGESSVPHRPSHDFIFQPVQASCGIQHVVNEVCGGDARRPHGGETPVSEEEIRVLLHQGAQLGTIDKKNRK